MFQWLPESVRYDMARGQVDKAYTTLERIARDNGKPMPLGRLVDQTHTSYTPVRPDPRCFPFTSVVANITEINKSSLRVLNWQVTSALVFGVSMLPPIVLFAIEQDRQIVSVCCLADGCDVFFSLSRWSEVSCSTCSWQSCVSPRVSSGSSGTNSHSKIQ